MSQPISYKKIITRAGDSFDGLALEHCGNEKLSSEIIALNPQYSNVLIFGEQIELTIPVYDTSNTPDTLPPWRQKEDEE